jgi:hypothetical protein
MRRRKALADFFVLGFLLEQELTGNRKHILSLARRRIASAGPCLPAARSLAGEHSFYVDERVIVPAPSSPSCCATG